MYKTIINSVVLAQKQHHNELLRIISEHRVVCRVATLAIITAENLFSTLGVEKQTSIDKIIHASAPKTNLFRRLQHYKIYDANFVNGAAIVTRQPL